MYNSFNAYLQYLQKITYTWSDNPFWNTFSFFSPLSIFSLCQIIPHRMQDIIRHNVNVTGAIEKWFQSEKIAALVRSSQTDN